MLNPPIEVLVVDDDALLREVLTARLRHEGYRVEAVENGRAGWEALLTSHPDILITDWLMPGMDGVQLCSAVRERREFDGMPIYMFAGRSTEEGDVAISGVAHARYVQKRSGLNSLMTALKDGIESETRAATVSVPSRQFPLLAVGAARS